MNLDANSSQRALHDFAKKIGLPLCLAKKLKADILSDMRVELSD